MNTKKDIEELKKYCTKYIENKEGKNNNFIKKMRATKNGLFIYGHKVYAPGYNFTYTIYSFINWYESGHYSYLNDMLDYFIADCKRLKEV